MAKKNSPNVDKFMRDNGDEPISLNIISSILTGSLKRLSSQFRYRAGSDESYH